MSTWEITYMYTVDVPDYGTPDADEYLDRIRKEDPDFQNRLMDVIAEGIEFNDPQYIATWVEEAIANFIIEMSHRGGLVDGIKAQWVDSKSYDTK